MTNEGAIEKLVELRHMHERRVFCVINDETDEALDMAIAALEKAPTRYSRTLVVKIPEEDIDKVGRIRLECKPWCRLFYEDCDRDIGAPAHSALDHIHSVVMDDAYRRGYEQGKADAEKEMHDNILRYRMPEPWKGEQNGQTD